MPAVWRARCAQALLLLIFVAVAAHAGPLAAQTTINKQVLAGSDDAEQQSTGAILLTQSRLNLGQEPWVGLRFQSLTIPQNALILTAYVQMRADVADSGATNLTIYGQAIDDAATFTTTNSNISTRARTAASVAWSVPTWTAASWYNSPEIKTIVQEVVDRAGWASGNDMAILFGGSGGRRRASSYEVGAASAPILVVQYVVPKTYYVRTDGSDSNAGTGTATTQAWRTINKALQSSVVNPGDTIYVRPGTYTESVTPDEDGTSTRPIRVIADTSGAVFGTAGTVLVQAPSGNEALDISGDDYLRFTGFSLRGEDGSFDTVSIATAPGSELHRCSIYNGGDKGVEMSGSTTTLSLTNCLIYDNNVDGIRVAAGTLSMWNSTIAANGSDGVEQDGGTTTIRNSIIASNTSDGLDLNSGTMTHTYNCVHANGDLAFEGTSISTGETTASPVFVGSGNYRLRNGSAAVNTGTSSGGPPGVDLDGATRPIGSGYDMGCYEFGGALLVGHWKLDETSGTTASDASGNAHHGTLSGLTFAANSVNGRDSTGLDFQGDDYISVNNTTMLQITTEMTISGWIKGDAWGSGSSVNTILRKGTDNPNNYQLAVADGKAALFLDDSDTGGVRGNTTLQTGRWYHVAATWDDAQVRIYLDGVLDMTPVARTGTIAVDTRALYLGGRASADYFDGRIDDVRLYNYALSAAEIRNLYGTLGHWKFDETSPATTAVDSSGNGYSAPIYGNSAWVAAGKVDGAIAFDGNGDYATTSVAFAPPADGSISFWMKSNALLGTQRILGLADGWEIRQSLLGVVTFDINGESRFSSVAILPITWYHIVAVFDDTNDKYSLYVNGTLQSSGTQTFTPQSAAALSFGTRTGSTEYWNGTLDDVRIYNRRLTLDEIAEQFSGGATALGVHILKWKEVQ